MGAATGRTADLDGASAAPSAAHRRGLAERLDGLCQEATHHPDVDGAGCLLIDADGALRAAATTSVAARSLAAAEELGGAGPCHEAAVAGCTMTRPMTFAAWPELETLLAAGPLRTIIAAPVVCDHIVVGAFYVVCEQDEPSHGLGLAEAAAIAARISNAVHDRLGGPDDLGERIATGIANQPRLAEAAAIISRQTGTSTIRSGRRLRQLAEAYDLPAATVAEHIVAMGRLPHPRELTSDSSERAHREELARLALTDPLTGLINRILLVDRLEHAVWRSQRAPGRPAVLYIDLDDFKRVNDTMGHAIGDQVLRTAAARIQAAVRPQDTVGRLGGDEFAVVCEAIDDPTVAVEIARRIANAVARPIALDPVRGDPTPARRHAPAIGASIGIAVAEPGQPADEVLRAADVAMYRSKASQRPVTVFGDRA